MGYSHIGSFVHISEDKTLSYDPGFWYHFVDSVSGAVSAIRQKGFDGVEDHNIFRYLNAIEARGDRPPEDWPSLLRKDTIQPPPSLVRRRPP
jgi:hypothetical protein